VEFGISRLTLYELMERLGISTERAGCDAIAVSRLMGDRNQQQKGR